jgi:hypothetical protein
MKVTILVPNPIALSAQVHELHRAITEIHEDQRPVTGRHLAILQTRVALLRQIEAVHGSWTGQWEERLAQAAARVNDSANRISEIDEIGRAITRTLGDNDIASCSASSVETALLAIDKYASSRKESHDSTTRNDGSIDAWGWDPDCDSEDSMTWRVTIRIGGGA